MTGEGVTAQRAKNKGNGGMGWFLYNAIVVEALPLNAATAKVKGYAALGCFCS